MKKKKNKEEILQEKLLKTLKPNFKNKQYEIGMEVPIPYKHVYLPNNSELKSEIWCFNQDIAIYKKYKTKESNTKLIKKDKLCVLKSDEIGLPFLIIEIKYGQPITDSIMTYAKKAEMIKSIFPYCRFLLLVKGRCDPRTYRLGASFDEIIEIEDENDLEEIEELLKTITNHLNIAEKLVNKLLNKKEK